MEKHDSYDFEGIPHNADANKKRHIAAKNILQAMSINNIEIKKDWTLKNLFRDIALRLHPDKATGDSKAAFQCINESFEILKKPCGSQSDVELNNMLLALAGKGGQTPYAKDNNSQLYFPKNTTADEYSVHIKGLKNDKAVRKVVFQNNSKRFGMHYEELNAICELLVKNNNITYLELCLDMQDEDDDQAMKLAINPAHIDITKVARLNCNPEEELKSRKALFRIYSIVQIKKRDKENDITLKGLPQNLDLVYKRQAFGFFISKFCTEYTLLTGKCLRTFTEDGKFNFQGITEELNRSKNKVTCLFRHQNPAKEVIANLSAQANYSGGEAWYNELDKLRSIALELMAQDDYDAILHEAEKNIKQDKQYPALNGSC